MNNAIFWERIKEMPDIEAEQELILRREELTLQKAMLGAQIDKCAEKEAKAIGREIRSMDASLTKINEELKIVRRRMDRLCWRNAVKANFGQEGFEKCLIWMEANREVKT